jgi:hypothetical protein
MRVLSIFSNSVDRTQIHSFEKFEVSPYSMSGREFLGYLNC